MRKCVLLYFFLTAAVISGRAQTFPGYRTGNYTGVNGVFFNPANIADNRYRWDVNVFAINGFVGTDQSGLRFSDITRSFNADSLKSKLLRGNSNVNSLSYVDVLGPSVMFSLSPKTSLAFTTRSRVFANGRNIDGNLAGAILDAGTTNTNIPFNFSSNMQVHATGWTEIGGSIGQVFSSKASHNFFKGGITLKYIAGTADSYLQTANLAGTVGGPGNTYLTNTTGSLALNTTAADFSKYDFSDFFKFNGHGAGGDVGLVYEWRPGGDYSMYQTDRFANKYKLRISASLLDVGRITFNRATNQSANYTVNIPALNQFNLNQFKGKTVSNYKGIFDASPYFTGTPQGSSYSVNLPTTIHAEVDWLLSERFGLNFAGQVKTTNNDVNSLSLYYYNSYSFTPRWETGMFSIELPINYNELTKFNAGVAFRAGPFFIGSGSVLSALVHDSKQADLHLGFHFGMQYKKKLKPDTDKDGVYDDVDKCPTVFGYARYQGCPIPDTDGDGVNDEEDSCKTVPGLPQFHGCPDTDGDGIPDKDDKCPTVPGVAKYQGCPVPDTDGDGIPDDQDLCPNDPGPASTKGCPVEKIAVQITADFKNILFDYGKSTIRPESDSILIRAAKIMNDQIPNSNFYIDGYTDSRGSVAINKRLSKARAQAVANALNVAGVDRSRVVARGFGKENPICDNKTEEGRQCNRRVEVVIRNVNQKEEKRTIKVRQ